MEIVKCFRFLNTKSQAKEVSIRLDKGDFGFYKIESPYWVAFKHDTGLLIGGVNEDGESEVTHSWIEGYRKCSIRGHLRARC
jgi:hypothetical protein